MSSDDETLTRQDGVRVKFKVKDPMQVDSTDQQNDNVTDDEKFCKQRHVSITVESLSSPETTIIDKTHKTAFGRSISSEKLLNKSDDNAGTCCSFCFKPSSNSDVESIEDERKFGLESSDIPNLEMAVCHIDDALHGRGSYGRARALKGNKLQNLCFTCINSTWYRACFILTVLLYGILVFWEPTQRDRGHSIQPESDIRWVLAVNALCLLIFLIDAIMHFVFYTCGAFWRIPEAKFIQMEFILTLLFIIDFIMLLIQSIVNLRLVAPFRCLRGLMIVSKAKNIQHVASVCLSVLKKLIKVTVVIGLFISIFSAVGIHLFIPSYHNLEADSTNSNLSTELVCKENSTNPYTSSFDHFGNAALQLFVLLTTENYPEFIMPAFNVSEWSIIYFGLFLYVGVFFLTSIVLAIVVDSYWELAKKAVKEERKKEREEIVKAWSILDPTGQEYLQVDNPKFYYILSKLKPNCTERELKDIMDDIDEDGDGFISTYEWITRLLDIIHHNIAQTSDQRSRKSWENPSLLKYVNSVWVSRLVLLTLVIHSVLFCVHWCGMSDRDAVIIHSIKTSLSLLCLVESLLRLIATSKVCQSFLEVVDLLLTVLAALCNLLWYIPTETNIISMIPSHRPILAITSGLAIICRVGLNHKVAIKGINKFRQIIPVMMDLMSLVLILMYFYAVLGWEIFYQKDFPNSNYGNDEFYNCGLGFQSFKCSFFMVFQIVSTSNWHELMNAAKIEVKPVSVLYFVTCYIALVLLFMNLFVAIAIEAFNKLAVHDEDSTEAATSNKTRSLAESAQSFFKSLLSTSRGIDTEELLSEKTEQGLTSEQDSKYTAEELAALEPDKRKEYLLKQKRMSRKLQPVRYRVVTAYRTKQSHEIDLHVGDEVTILRRNGEMWRGETKTGKCGWFPASCVQEVLKGSVKVNNKRNEAAATEAQGNQFIESSHQQIEGSVRSRAIVHMAARIFSKENIVVPSSANPGAALSTTQKTKFTTSRAGDWRRKILGNMTVMNHEEMIELSKKLRAGRTSSNNSTLHPSHSDGEPAESSRVSSDHQSPQIQISSISEVEETEFGEVFDDNQSEQTSREATGENSKSRDPSQPHTSGQTQSQPQRNGEIPDWAKKFLERNQLRLNESKNSTASSTEAP